MTRLDDYRPLGRSGLRVSPLALGAMTFGTGSFCAADDTSRKIFRAYVEGCGNFVDTADNYSARSPEQLAETLGALELDLTDAQLDRLTAVSAPELPFPHGILARLNAGLPS